MAERRPKALLFNFRLNEEALEYKDLSAFAIGLQRAGYDVHRATTKELNVDLDSYPIEEFDLITYIPQLSLHVSSPRNYRVLTEIFRRAKEGALSVLFCDTTIKVDPYIWDPKRRAETRHNYLATRPVKFIGSFSKEVLDDREAMEVFKFIHMRHAHPDSVFVPIEWLTFYHDLSEQAGIVDYSNHPEEIVPRSIDRFYYGMKKRKMVPSLKSMGFGTSDSDGVFGSMAELFKHMEDLRISPKKAGREFWVPYAQMAKEVLIPYDPIKCEYQVTLRLLEALHFYPETAVMDQKIAEWIQPFARSREPWIERQALTVSALGELSRL